jgi:Asp-tRNA(Asn)/Glu-tRNA(Gln) amidotransferase C subunit
MASSAIRAAAFRTAALVQQTRGPTCRRQLHAAVCAAAEPSAAAASTGGGGGGAAVQPPDVRKLAKMAQLEVTDAEVAEWGPKIERIVEWFGQLQQIDLEGVPPALRADVDDGDFLRDDVEVEFANRCAPPPPRCCLIAARARHASSPGHLHRTARSLRRRAQAGAAGAGARHGGLLCQGAQDQHRQRRQLAAPGACNCYTRCGAWAKQRQLVGGRRGATQRGEAGAWGRQKLGVGAAPWRCRPARRPFLGM